MFYFQVTVRPNSKFEGYRLSINNEDEEDHEVDALWFWEAAKVKMDINKCGTLISR